MYNRYFRLPLESKKELNIQKEKPCFNLTGDL